VAEHFAALDRPAEGPGDIHLSNLVAKSCSKVGLREPTHRHIAVARRSLDRKGRPPYAQFARQYC
jgi:hypothetical protein